MLCQNCKDYKPAKDGGANGTCKITGLNVVAWTKCTESLKALKERLALEKMSLLLAAEIIFGGNFFKGVNCVFDLIEYFHEQARERMKK